MPAVGVSVQKVNKKMGRAQALKDVSSDFEASRVHGVIGPDGAGKTTLMRLTAGLLRPDGGQVAYNCGGARMQIKSAKEFIGYFPQEPSLYPDLSCLEHLEFFRDLYNIGPLDFKARSEELLNATDMSAFSHRPAGKLSGGMYKKLGLMCVLLNRPGLLLLDEPTTGVDPLSRRQLWDLIYRFSGAEMTVIINTSYMDEAKRCAKIHMMREGVTLASGAPQELMDKFQTANFADIFIYGKR